MSVPEQVRKQSEAVQELYRKLEGGGDPEPKTEDKKEEQVAPVEAPAPAPVAVATRSELEVITQKYNTLQGMYKADTQKLDAQNRELLGRITSLENLLRQQQSPPPSPPPQHKYVTDSDVAEYGDSIEVMRKVTKEEFAPVIQRYQQEIETLKKALNSMHNSVVPQVEQLGRNQAASAEEGFWDDLEYAVPNFREVNEDQGFQNWLLSVDPLTGITRQTYLADAQQHLDSRRVIAFFKQWTDMTAAPQPNPQPKPNPAQSELEKQVAPGRGRTVEPKPQDAKKTYSQEEIKKFFRDSAMGLYKGREAEKARIEADIIAAPREGRIT